MEARRLDVADSESVRELSAGLDRDLGRLDVLVNNAAIHYDTWQRGSTRTWAWFRRRSTPTCWAPADGPGLSAAAPLRARAHRERLEQSGSLASMGRCSGLQRQQGGAQRAHAGARRRIAPESILVNSVCPGCGHGHGVARRAAGGGWGGKRDVGRAPSGRRAQRWLLP